MVPLFLRANWTYNVLTMFYHFIFNHNGRSVSLTHKVGNLKKKITQPQFRWNESKVEWIWRRRDCWFMTFFRIIIIYNCQPFINKCIAESKQDIRYQRIKFTPQKVARWTTACLWMIGLHQLLFVTLRPIVQPCVNHKNDGINGLPCNRTGLASDLNKTLFFT